MGLVTYVEEIASSALDPPAHSRPPITPLPLRTATARGGHDVTSPPHSPRSDLHADRVRRLLSTIFDARTGWFPPPPGVAAPVIAGECEGWVYKGRAKRLQL